VILPVAFDYSAGQVAELLRQHAIQLIDVREDYEWEAGRIAGAVHIRLMELPERAAEIDRERPVVFYCRSGTRSAMAGEALATDGFDAHNMAGGLLEWEAAGLPLDPDGGVVADH
jgi:rhodanese-related sulfurtransferase